MEESVGIKIKYLDTSSIIKLYFDEDGSDDFREYFYKHTNFCTVLMTYYESMNILKAKLFKSDRNKYIEAVSDLAIHGWRRFPKIEIENIDLDSFEIFKEVSELSIKYNIDIADAIQIYAILKGKYSRWIFDSAPVLITADNQQEAAAKDNKIRVWNCRKSAKPEWIDN
jgi:predicted nucleic acid-binding protein